MDSLNPENKLPNLKNEFAIFLCPQRPLTPIVPKLEKTLIRKTSLGL